MLPVFIPCHNNGWMVKKTINDLYKFNICTFIILDNASDTILTLDILNELEQKDRVEIIRYPDNGGPHRVYFEERFKQYWENPYILTDPDLDLSTLPDNTMDVLLYLSKKYNIGKLGLALNIFDKNDISEFFLKIEFPYWRFRLNLAEDPQYEIYNAQIDTTFSLITKNQHGGPFQCRLAGKYAVKHLPFHKSYIQSLEEKYFNEYFNDISISKISTSLLYAKNYRNMIRNNDLHSLFVICIGKGELTKTFIEENYDKFPDLNLVILSFNSKENKESTYILSTLEKTNYDRLKIFYLSNENINQPQTIFCIKDYIKEYYFVTFPNIKLNDTHKDLDKVLLQLSEKCSCKNVSLTSNLNIPTEEDVKLNKHNINFNLIKI